MFKICNILIGFDRSDCQSQQKWEALKMIEGIPFH